MIESTFFKILESDYYILNNFVYLDIVRRYSFKHYNSFMVG